MTLNALEKLTKIVLGGVGAFFLGWVGLAVNWEKLGVDRSSFCFDAIFKLENETLSEGFQVEIASQELAKQCDATLEDSIAFVASKSTTATFIAENSDPLRSGPEEATQIGYVAIGRADPIRFSDVSFEYPLSNLSAVRGDNIPVVGDVLRARWAVNIRPSAGTDELAIQILQSGQCIKILEMPELTGTSYWAPIAKSDCT